MDFFPSLVLSTLGRQVKLGYSSYNYNEDTITSLNDLKAPVGPISIANSFRVELTFSTSKNLNDFKWKQLQLNSHLRSSILTGILAGPFWFSGFLDESESTIAGKIFAKVAVHVLARKSQDHKLGESNLKTIKEKLKDSKNISHVVSGLVYGFNAFLTFEIEVSSLTEKKEVEACMYLEAKRVFTELTPSIDNDSCQTNIPISWLKKAKFQFYSDRTFPSAETYEDILSYLKNAIINGQNSGDNVPIEMTLSPINDRNPMIDYLDTDSFNALQHLYTKKSAINEQYQLLMTDPLLTKIPYLQPRVMEFKEIVVDENFKEISQTLRSAVKSFRRGNKTHMELINQTQIQLMEVIEERQLAMERVSHWFLARQQELSVFRSLLKDVNINWTTDLEQFYQENFQDHVQVFLFKTQEVTESFSLTDGYVKVLKSTVYAILSAGETARQKFRDNIVKFSAKLQKKKCSVYLSPSTNCHVTGVVSTINSQQENSLVDEDSTTEYNADSKFTTPTSNLDVENLQSVEKSAICSTPTQSYRDPNKSNSLPTVNSKAFKSNMNEAVPNCQPSHQPNESRKDENWKSDRNDITHRSQVPTPTPNLGTEKVEIIDNKEPQFYSFPAQSYNGWSQSNSQSVLNSNDFTSEAKKLASIQPCGSTKQDMANLLTPTCQQEVQVLELKSNNHPSNDYAAIQQSPAGIRNDDPSSHIQINNDLVIDDNGDSDDIIETNPTANYTDISTSLNQVASLSIAKLFAERCQILEKGEPTIYMLEAHERVSSNKNLRWFEIRTKPTSDEKLNDKSRNHKILILMGATGAGKSTLINGMINYILGVEWNDPFRFKIVNDLKSGDGSGKEVNQAHSQTSCVTAYTIHHVEGMKIPYDITIIDTPGYADTQGIERDREITSQIEQFLVHPQTNKEFNYINAVCFVANSAESRFTPAQKYIFESIASIFGKDIRQNLRLLVTFSDGNKPPVLEAVRLANIPGLSDQQPDGSIKHHKLNSSALYAQNSCAGNVGSSEISFQMGFWKLGMENFKIFFDILATMPDRSWEQTRQVILNRDGIKKSQQKVLLLLDIYLEKIKLFQSLSLIFKEHETKLAEACQILKQKNDSMKRRVQLKGKYLSENCKKCKISCKKIHSSNDNQAFPDEQCTNCKCPASTHDPESYEWLCDTPDEDYESKKRIFLSCDKAMQLAEDELSKCNSDFLDLETQMMNQLQIIDSSTKYLESSTLNNSLFTVVDYINSIISDLENKKQGDYSSRVKILKNLLKRYEDEKAKSNNSSKPIGSSTTTV